MMRRWRWPAMYRGVNAAPGSWRSSSGPVSNRGRSSPHSACSDRTLFCGDGSCVSSTRGARSTAGSRHGGPCCSAPSALVALPDVRAQDEPPRPVQSNSAAPGAAPRSWLRPPPRPAALRVRGKVLDARTGQPIGTFTLIRGALGRAERGARDLATGRSSRTLTGGRYDEAGFLPVLDRGRNYALRVEAPGYVPGEFFGIEDDADAIENDFRLVREGPRGIVRTPDGKPAAGAVVVRSPRDDAWRFLQNGRFTRAGSPFSGRVRDRPRRSLRIPARDRDRRA